MSREQLQQKSHCFKKQLETGKDTYNDAAVVDVPSTSEQEEMVSGISTMNGGYPSRSVTVVIDVDSDTDDVLDGNYVEDGIIIQSDASSTEDCIIEDLESSEHHVSDHASKPAFRLRKCQEQYEKTGSSRHARSAHFPLVSSSDSDSDCELLESSVGICAEWKKAALRKQKLKETPGYEFSIEDQGSVSGSNLDPKAFSCETSQKNVDLESYNSYNFEDENFAEFPVCSNFNTVHSDEGNNMARCAATSDGIKEENHPKSVESEVIVGCTSQLSGTAVQEGSCFDKVDAGHVNHEHVQERVFEEQSPSNTHLHDLPSAKSAPVDFVDEIGAIGAKDDILGAKEKLKGTAEYKLADKEEWESRHRELQLQAKEAQRLRRSKKAERRLLDMERRQKQRVDEVRETQKKDEETMNLKEKYRIEVRNKLSQYELMYRDMASLLRGLGIHVGGSPNPMPDEVNAAYKRALVKFHPDRAARGDIQQQVEAEETFKMISRLKDTLPLTLDEPFPTSQWKW